MKNALLVVATMLALCASANAQQSPKPDRPTGTIVVEPIIGVPISALRAIVAENERLRRELKEAKKSNATYSCDSNDRT